MNSRGRWYLYIYSGIGWNSFIVDYTRWWQQQQRQQRVIKKDSWSKKKLKRAISKQRRFQEVEIENTVSVGGTSAAILFPGKGAHWFSFDIGRLNHFSMEKDFQFKWIFFFKCWNAFNGHHKCNNAFDFMPFISFTATGGLGWHEHF